MLLDKEATASINQLFAHITANRNINRLPKQGFDLVFLTENTLEKLKKILTELFLSPIREEFECVPYLGWAIDGLKETYEEATDLLKKESEFAQKPEFRYVQFNVSGANQIEEIE